MIKIDRYLFVLHPAHGHASHGRDASQTALQQVHVVVQLAIGFVFTFHCDEQSRSVTEIILHDECQHIARQLALELRYAMLELAPELVFVSQIIIQFHLYVYDAVAAFRESFFFLHFLIGEDIVFQRLGYLFNHFPGRIARSHCHYNTLTDGEVGKLVLAHFGQAVHAECHQASHYQDDNLPVVHRPFHKVTFFLFHNA